MSLKSSWFAPTLPDIRYSRTPEGSKEPGQNVLALIPVCPSRAHYTHHFYLFLSTEYVMMAPVAFSTPTG